MKIPLEKITNKGLRVGLKVPAENWNLDGFDLKFINRIELNLTLKREYGQINSRVDIITHRLISCSRCLIEACQIKKYNFQRDYQLVDLGDFFNIESDIREEILLNFPLKVLCSKDCRGLCPGCGVNLNWKKCNC